MDKYENKVKIEEIKSLASQGEFEKAAEIADTIEWATIKNIYNIGMVSDIYKMLHRYEAAKNVLLFAYDRQKNRPIVKSLCELSIELGDLMDAMSFLQEFTDIAPKDPYKYVLQYKLYKMQDVSLDEQIEVLEQLKEYDQIDRWEYELATLYYRAGMADKCVEQCNYIILWFVDGKYVIKAYELKAQIEPLSEFETYKYEVLRQAGGKLNIQYSLTEDEPKEDAPKEFAVGQDVSPYNTQNLQAVVAEGLQDVLEQKTTVVVDKVPETMEEAVALDNEINSANEIEAQFNTESNLLVTQMYNPVVPEAPVGQELEGKANEDVADVNRSDEEIIGGAASDMAADMLKQHLDDQEEEFEIKLNQNTDEIKLITGELPKIEPVENTEQEMSFEDSFIAAKSKDAINNTGVIETFHRGSNFDNMLSQGYDGQISLVIPEEKPIEKQITGQLSIDDIMLEWERKKKETEKKLVEDVKARVKNQANNLLADFDEETKSSLLGQIENAMVNAALKEEHDRIAAGRPKQIKVSDISTPIETPKETLKEPVEEPVVNSKDKEQDDLAAKLLKDKEELEAKIKQLEEEKARAEEQLKVEKERGIKEAVADMKKSKDDSDDAKANEEGVEELEEIEETSEDNDESLENVEDDNVSDKIAQDTSSEDVEEETEEIFEDDEEETDEEDTEEEDYEERDIHSGPRDLTDAQLDRFGSFVHHRKSQQDLAYILDNVTLASYAGNILVSSEEDSEVTTFSKLLIQEIQQSDSNFTGKVALISGENLNKKDVAQSLEKVKNGAMIISEPQLLKKKTVEALIKELNKDGLGLVVIMQGHADVLDKIVEQNEGMAEAFDLRIDLEAFDDKTLVEYAITYANERGYSIDDFGILALHTRISDLQTAEHEVTLSEIEDMVEDAIYYADKKTPAKLLGAMFGKRYDDNDLIVLHEKDFMHY